MTKFSLSQLSVKTLTKFLIENFDRVNEPLLSVHGRVNGPLLSVHGRVNGPLLSVYGRFKPKIMYLIFTTSPLSQHHCKYWMAGNEDNVYEGMSYFYSPGLLPVYSPLSNFNSIFKRN